MATGALLACSFPPVGAWPLSWIALAPWLVAAPSLGKRRAAWTAVGLCAIWAVVDLWWGTLFGPGLLGGAALAAGVFHLACFAVPFALAARVMAGRGLLAGLGLAALWTGLELIRSGEGTPFELPPIVPFPYLFLGHSQAAWTAVVQVADVAGVYGVTFAIALANVAVAGVARDLIARRRPAVSLPVAAGAVVAGSLVYGAVRVGQVDAETRPGPKLFIVQANIRQHVKVMGDAGEILREHVDLTRDALGDPELDLVIWPESMLPYVLEGSEGARLAMEEVVVRRVAATSPCLIGAMVALTDEPMDPVLGGPRTANAAFLVAADGRVLGRHDKAKLVAWGEWVPYLSLMPGLARWLKKEVGYLPDSRPGAKLLPLALPLRKGGVARFGVSICYGACFPRAVAATARGDAATGPADFLVNISNEAWFLDSAELDQMDQTCRFRCVENRTGMARATNSGISGFIDPVGRRTAVIQGSGGRTKGVAGTLAGRIATRPAGSVYLRIGDAFAFACLALGLLATAAFAIRDR